MAEPSFSSQDIMAFKRRAAAAAAALAGPGMAVGLGHGSTAVLAVAFLAARARRGELDGTVFVPAAHYLAEALRTVGLPIVTLEDRPDLDLAIDGADEVDGAGRCIKGGGGALLNEKILAQASRRLAIVVDATKLSPALGTRHALPVEVVPFALGPVTACLAGLGGKPALRRRADGDPVRTEHANFLLDCAFGPIPDPAGLAASLDARAGVAGHGLFLTEASDILVAGPDGVRRLPGPAAAGSAGEAPSA